jgi:tetratricopeptide (TPR) repeat protein
MTDILPLQSNRNLDASVFIYVIDKMSFRRTNGLRISATFFAVAGILLAAGPSLEEACKFYNLTQFEQSLKVLQSIPKKDAAIDELIGRNLYMQGEYKKATEALDRASSADPASSEIAMWAGRAYGRRAETSSPFTAPGHASKARQYFEKSVQLNPKNVEAWSDLFEFYLEAPGFLGGGLDKATQAATQLAVIDPSEGHWAQAKLAEKRKEYASAEEQLRRAIDASPQRIGRFIDLARFLTRQGRYQEADQSIERAEKIAPDSPRLMYAKADLYIKQGRNLESAKDLLKRYMSAKLTPDDPPRSDAARLLRQVQGS